MRRSVGMAAALGCAAALLPAAPAAADGAAVGDVGWWTRNPLASAPEGGMAVSHAPDGAVSVGAVRVRVEADLEGAALVLSEVAGGGGHELAELQVCPTPNTWKAGRGDLPDAPKAECEGSSATMKRNPTLRTWSADVLPLLGDAEPGESVSLMVVPAAGVASAWDVPFESPEIIARAAPATESAGAGSPSSSGGYSSGPVTGGTTPSSASGDYEPSSGSFGGGGYEPSFSGGDQPATPPGPAISGPDAGAGTAEPTVEDASPAGGRTDQRVAFGGGGLPVRALASSSGDGPSGLEALILVVLSAIGAVAAGLGRHRLRLRAPSSIS